MSINLIDIKDKIGKGIGKYNLFIIYEPKQRLILNQDLFNKIVNHLVGNELINVLEKSLIDSNIAVRINKGTSYGIKLIKKYIKELNYNYYCLMIDIKKYFYSINHNILKDLLNKKIKDKLFLDIVYKIIDSTNEDYIFEYAMKHNINYLKKYDLELNNKTIITKNSLCFLGYRFYNKNIKILSKNRRRIYKKLRILKYKDYNKYIKSLSSYYGYFKVQKY